MRNAIAVSLVVMFGLLRPVSAADEWFSLREYSNLTFVKLEGETNGLSIAFVPYSGGTKILWRMGSGPLGEPLLLDATQDGKHTVVVVPPPYDGSGEWQLTEEKGIVMAKGPNELSFRLKRTR